MYNRTEEIASFLSHHDYSLARRRLLDFSLDAGDNTLLKKTIAWSEKVVTATAQKGEENRMSDEMLAEANDLLSQLIAYEETLADSRRTLIVARDISKRYAKGNFSLHPISLQLATNEVSGIVGENGNGKTTLLRCLAGQLAIDNGSIEYAQLNKPDQYDIKSHVAFIPQRIPQWFGRLKDNLHFSASLSGITGEANDTMVAFMLERLNLSQYAHLTWSQISSGYRTRFEIARVLLQRPSLLILDEPLANLDINAQQTMLTDLRYLAGSVHHPMGIFLSSQQLHEVEKIADVVYFIKMGKCLYHTGQTDSGNRQESVIEIETSASRETIMQAFEEGEIRLHFNGGYYTLSSTQLQPAGIVTSLLQNGIPVTYFRDITHSTKRFF